MIVFYDLKIDIVCQQFGKHEERTGNSDEKPQVTDNGKKGKKENKCEQEKDHRTLDHPE